MANFKELAPFCAAATTFWRNNVLPDGERVILVEAMSQDIRVTLRNLTLANALRRITPARLVVYTGADTDWLRLMWSDFDVELLTSLAKAYGATDVFDVHALVDTLTAEHPPAAFELAGRTFDTDELRTGIDPRAFDDLVHATAARVYKAPRISAEEQRSARYQEIRRRSEKFAQVYEALMEAFDPVALITSHVDYNHWGLAVEAAQRFDVPVLHVQSTGTFKAYALFPETKRGDLTYRGELTKQIGQYFDQHVWARRKELQRAAELTTWRNKGNLGRPSWWRGRGDISAIEMRTNSERDTIREHAMQRFGFDPAKPVVAVYNHAISDALNTNVEIFEDLAAWFEHTVEYAARHDDVNWLFVDHPSQDNYDATGFFGAIADRHTGVPHLGFVESWDISKNLMWSLVDLGVTVRGSISTELPAFGIPCIQAGWSEWSELGFSRLATDEADYWRVLDGSIAALRAGEPLLTDQQIDKARLWMWFYRSASDVPSVFVQQWELGEGQGDVLFNALRMTMQYVESDEDPVFESTRRMWTRKEPFLTRFDLPRLEPGTLEVSTGEPGGSAATDPDAHGARPRLLTAYDRRVPALAVPGTLSRGDNPALQIVDGMSRGLSVPGRFGSSPGLFAVKVDTSQAGATIPVTLTLALDDVSLAWWHDRAPGAGAADPDPTAARVLLVRSQGRTRTAVVLDRAGKGPGRTQSVSFELDGAEVEDGGLLTVELVDPALPPWAADVVARSGAIGVVVGSVAIGEPGPVAVITSTNRGLFAVATDDVVVRPVMTKPPAGAAAAAVPKATANAKVPPRPADEPTVRASTHTLPPPEPRTRPGRWAARWKTRMQAEARINGSAGTGEARRDRPVKPVPALEPAPVVEEASEPVSHADVLGELIADLLHDRRIVVRAVSLVDGVEARLPVRSAGGNDLAISVDPSLRRPVLLRVQVAEDELATAPELTRYGVVWHVLPGGSAGAAGDQE